MDVSLRDSRCFTGDMAAPPAGGGGGEGPGADADDGLDDVLAERLRRLRADVDQIRRTAPHGTTDEGLQRRFEALSGQRTVPYEVTKTKRTALQAGH